MTMQQINLFAPAGRWREAGWAAICECYVPGSRWFTAQGPTDRKYHTAVHSDWNCPNIALWREQEIKQDAEGS